MRKGLAGLSTALIMLAAIAASPLALVPTAVAATPAPWSASQGMLIEGARRSSPWTPRGTTSFQPEVCSCATGKIVAIWSGPKPPKGISVGNASVVKAGPLDLLFPA